MISDEDFKVYVLILAALLLFLLVFYTNRMDDKEFMESMNKNKNNKEEECVSF